MALSNRQLATATISLLVFRLTTAFLVELTPQEAYYWNYTIHPALSYFDHPPVVAWVIRAGYLVLGKSELGIRIGGFVLTVLSTWLLFVLGKLWFNKKAGLWAALLFQLVPLFLVYGVLVTPDVPLTFFWLLTVYWVSLAVREDRPWLWYLAGVALGFCLLSKYTAVFLLPSTFLFLLAERRYRGWLARKEPYCALILALIIFTPVLLWNMENRWASFTFQVSDRLNQVSSNPLRRLGEFLLIQFGVTSPTLIAGLILSPALPISLALKKTRARWRLAVCFALPLLVFLLAYSSRSAVKANWTLPGYLSLLVAAHPCYRYLRFNSGTRTRLVVRYFLLVWFWALPVIYVAAVFHSTVTLPGVTVHRWTTGWREMGRLTSREADRFEAETGKKVFLLGMDSHYVASALSFYADGSRPVFSRNLIGKPARAFDYWQAVEPLGFNGLAVGINRPDVDTLKKYCNRVGDQVERIPLRRGNRTLHYVFLVKCYGYKGIRSQ